MRVGDCKNFKGIQRDMCKAGVDMRKLSGTAPGMLACIPCLAMHADKHCIKCESYDPKTQEDVDRQEQEAEAMYKGFLRDLTILQPLINRLKAQYSDGAVGAERCPVCDEGILNYSISGVNQHIHMKCTKDGCVHFME